MIVGGIFLLAGLGKVGSPGEFADAIRAFHILPENLVLPYAYIVPWLEILAGVYLLIGFMTRFAAALTILLLISFIVAIADSLVTGHTNHSCGCFGANPNPIVAWLSGGNSVTLWDLIRDIILVALCVPLMVFGPGRISVEGFIASRRSVA